MSGGFWLTLLVLLMIVTLAAGIYPAFVLSSVRPVRAAQAGKVRGGGGFVARLLVGLQFAGASFLVISMLVMAAQNREFKRAILSGSADTLVSISNNIARAGVDYEVLRTELLRQPHIRGVSASLFSPGAMVGNTQILAASTPEAARRVPVNASDINYDFFSTLDIPLLAGRPFERSHDDAATAASGARNIVIDRQLAEELGWSTPAEAVGKTTYRIAMDGRARAPTPLTVVGVVENRALLLVSPFGATGNMYVLNPTLASLPIIRVDARDAPAALAEIKSVWARVAPDVALKTEFIDESVERAYRYFDLIKAVFTGVAALALAISVLGLIGMSIHVIGRRQHEIGVRKTLGASVASVVQLLLTDFSKPVIVANLVAWPLAYVVMNLYLSVFTQRTSLSAAPFILSFVLTLLIAWTAVGAQATRAARLKPATVLRYE
jgi:putative ABC transport system permease protein